MANPIDQRSLKWLEYVDETVLGTIPTNPAMRALPGDLTKFDYTTSLKTDSYNAFQGATATDPLSAGKVVVTAEEHEWSFTCKASSLALLPHALMAATVSGYTPSNVHLPITLGAVEGGKFGTWKGCAIEEWICNIPDAKKTAEISVSGVAMDRGAFSATDYKGTGTHATAPSAAPYKLSSLTSILFDGADPKTANLSIESLKFGVKNDVSPVIDAASSLASKIGFWSFGAREFVLEMKVTILDASVVETLRAGGTHTFAFTLGAKTFTFSNVVFVNPGKIGNDPESAIAITLKADGGALRLAIA